MAEIRHKKGPGGLVMVHAGARFPREGSKPDYRDTSYLSPDFRGKSRNSKGVFGALTERLQFFVGDVGNFVQAFPTVVPSCFQSIKAVEADRLNEVALCPNRFPVAERRPDRHGPLSREKEVVGLRCSRSRGAQRHNSTKRPVISMTTARRNNHHRATFNNLGFLESGEVTQNNRAGSGMESQCHGHMITGCGLCFEIQERGGR